MGPACLLPVGRHTQLRSDGGEDQWNLELISPKPPMGMPGHGFSTIIDTFVPDV